MKCPQCGGNCKDEALIYTPDGIDECPCGRKDRHEHTVHDDPMYETVKRYVISKGYVWN